MNETDMKEEVISYNITEELKHYIPDWKLHLMGEALYEQLSRDLYFYDLANRQNLDSNEERRMILKTIKQINQITIGTPEEEKAKKAYVEKVKADKFNAKLNNLYAEHIKFEKIP